MSIYPESARELPVSYYQWTDKVEQITRRTPVGRKAPARLPMYVHRVAAPDSLQDEMGKNIHVAFDGSLEHGYEVLVRGRGTLGLQRTYYIENRYEPVTDSSFRIAAADMNKRFSFGWLFQVEDDPVAKYRHYDVLTPYHLADEAEQQQLIDVLSQVDAHCVAQGWKD